MRRSVDLKVTEVTIHVALAELLERSKRSADALEVLEEASAIAPRNAAVRYLRGLVLSSLRRYEAALVALEAALEGKPSENLSVSIRRAQGQCHLQLGNPESALEALEWILSRHPEHPEAAGLEEVVRAIRAGGIRSR